MQVRDPYKSDQQGAPYYENYVSSIKYVAAELGAVRDQRFYGEATCGPVILGTIDGINFMGVKGEKPECGFYLKSIDEMGV